MERAAWATYFAQVSGGGEGGGKRKDTEEANNVLDDLLCTQARVCVVFFLAWRGPGARVAGGGRLQVSWMGECK